VVVCEEAGALVWRQELKAEVRQNLKVKVVVVAVVAPAASQ